MVYLQYILEINSFRVEPLWFRVTEFNMSTFCIDKLCRIIKTDKHRGVYSEIATLK